MCRNLVSNKHSMATNLPILVVWLVCFGLALDAAVSSDNNGVCQSRVEANGYRCEDHTVTTKDGYILGMQRIPTGRSGPSSGANKIPVILQHGLTGDGAYWLLSSPAESLAFILADNGYDVWILNARGTEESRGHTSLSSTDRAYWDWSWDEMSAFDLPANFQYIYNQTGQQKIHYVGHSLGTTMVVGSIIEGNILSMIRSAVLLSPIVYMNQMTSAFMRASADLFFGEASYWMGQYEFDPMSDAARAMEAAACNAPGVNCYDFMAAVTGPNCCLAASTMQVFLQHEPQPTAVKNMIHLSQMIRTGAITKYDYENPVLNMMHYGQMTPPAYDISHIPSDLPIFIGAGGMDLLSDTNDVNHLLDSLKPHDANQLTVKYVANYAHMDLPMATNAKQMMFDPMMAFFALH